MTFKVKQKKLKEKKSFSVQKRRNRSYYVTLVSPVKELGKIYVEGKYPSGVKNYSYEINTSNKEKKLGKHLFRKEGYTFSQKERREYKKKYKETPEQYLISLHKSSKIDVDRYRFLRRF